MDGVVKVGIWYRGGRVLIRMSGLTFRGSFLVSLGICGVGVFW